MCFDNLPNTVYHATLSIYKESLKNGIDINKGDQYVDFGQGFYTTSNFKQAKSFAIKRSKAYNKTQFKKSKKFPQYHPNYSKPIIFTYSINKEMLFDLNGLIFKDCNNKWAEFVYNNRLGIDFLYSDYHNIYKDYDFVFGCMADAEIALAIQDVKSGILSFRKFCTKIEPYDKYYQNQFSFHTKTAIKALECINIIKM